MIFIKIKVVDQIMGSGKSTAIKQTINDDYKNGGSDNKYIFITPYLKQIEDKDNNRGIVIECPNAKFKQPKNLGDGKLDNLHNLIINNQNIATTHMLFTYASEQTYELLRINEYIIVIDEVLQIMDTTVITVADYNMLIRQEVIKVTEDDTIEWIDSSYTGAFDYLKGLCTRGVVFKSTVKERDKKILNTNNNKYETTREQIQLLVWNLDPSIFKTHSNDIYILTYLFEGSYMYLYFKSHNINFKKYIIQNNKLIGFNSNIKENKEDIRKLIHLYEGKLNNIGDNYYSLSMSWFNNTNNRPLVKQLQRNTYNFLRNIHKAKGREIIWTTFIDHKNKIKGKGYSNSFLQCAEKGSNEYGDRIYIAYCCNRFFHPDDITYFHNFNIDVKDELWTLSEMIQFIWRSAIRNGKEVYLYIPSSRMRGIFKHWLES